MNPIQIPRVVREHIASLSQRVTALEARVRELEAKLGQQPQHLEAHVPGRYIRREVAGDICAE